MVGEYRFMLLVFILFPWLLATVGNKSCVGWVLGPGTAALVLHRACVTLLLVCGRAFPQRPVEGRGGF